MHHDVRALRDFYYTTSLGRAVQKALRDRLTDAWGSADGLSVGGFGFAAPLLRPFMDQAQRVIRDALDHEMAVVQLQHAANSLDLDGAMRGHAVGGHGDDAGVCVGGAGDVLSDGQRGAGFELRSEKVVSLAFGHGGFSRKKPAGRAGGL